MRGLDARRMLWTRTRRACALLALGAAISLSLIACGEEDEATSSPTQSAAKAAPPKSVPYRATADGKTLIGPGNQRIPVRPGAITGYVDNVIADGEIMNLTGWAATADLSRPVEEVVAVVARTGIGQAEASMKRPDVVEAYGESTLARSGFVLGIAQGSVDCSEPAGGVVVLGIVDGLAGPLTWVADSDQLLTDEAC